MQQDDAWYIIVYNDRTDVMLLSLVSMVVQRYLPYYFFALKWIACGENSLICESVFTRRSK